MHCGNVYVIGDWPEQSSAGKCECGKYIVDFCCRESRLVIEIDGSQHEQQQEYDAERTKFLTANGYRVIRFSNTDVLAGIEGVLKAIGAALEGQARDN